MIVETALKWKGTLQRRSATNDIILHHGAVKTATVNEIHQAHINKGWSGIGYHLYVRKDGTIYRGRPLYTVGAHCLNHNNESIGICAEGNFETEQMTETQKRGIAGAIAYVKEHYPNAEIKKHSELGATACPGKYFPFLELKNNYMNIYKGGELTTVNDIVWELNHRGIIENSALWLNKLETDRDAYWLARKAINYIKNK